MRDVAFHIENPREVLGLEDSQWMYLPVSRQTRRISTTDKRGAFMGSDYSYADLDQIDSITHSETEDFIAGTRSRLRFNQLQYNVVLDDRLFTQTAIKCGLIAGDLPDTPCLPILGMLTLLTTSVTVYGTMYLLDIS
ncbi:hypothetical protein O999_05380 [Pseudomonas putida LF54]|nr:hypothetical protein O999_05380 [Pseudomonas putida LF54]